MSAGKKVKKPKGKTLSIGEFLGASNPAAGGQAVVSILPKSSWADESEDYDDDHYPNVKQEQLVLPTCPRTARGPDVDPDRIPVDPPFTAYMANLPFEVSKEEINLFFTGLTVSSIRLPKEGGDGGRFKGFGYVEFATRQDLVDGLSKNDDMMGSRKIRVDIAEGEGGNQRRGFSDRGGGGYDDVQEDRSGGVSDWRSAPAPAMPESDRRSVGFGDRDRERGASFGDRDRERSGGFVDRDRGSGGGYGDRDRDRDRGSSFGDRDRGGAFADRDRGGGGSGFVDRDRGFRDRGYDKGTHDRDKGGCDRDRGGYDRDRGGYDRDRGEFDRGGYDRDRSGYDKDRGYDRDRGGRDGGDPWRRDRDPAPPRGPSREDDGPKERPKLQLKPRSVAEGEKKEGSGSSIFGDAKPVDTASRERIQLKPRSAPEGDKDKPVVPRGGNIFGDAKPVDTASREKQIEEVKLKAEKVSVVNDLARPHDIPREKKIEDRVLKPDSSAASKPKSGGAGASIFGAAKPVDTAAREREIEQKLLKDGVRSVSGNTEDSPVEGGRRDDRGPPRVIGRRDDRDNRDERNRPNNYERRDDKREDLTNGKIPNDESRKQPTVKDVPILPKIIKVDSEPILDTTNKFAYLSVEEEA